MKMNLGDKCFVVMSDTWIYEGIVSKEYENGSYELKLESGGHYDWCPVIQNIGYKEEEWIWVYTKWEDAMNKARELKGVA